MAVGFAAVPQSRRHSDRSACACANAGTASQAAQMPAAAKLRTMVMLSSVCGSIDRDVAVGDELGPFRRLAPDVVRHFLRRAVQRLDARIAHLLAHGGIGN